LYTHQCIKPDIIPSCVHVDGSSRVQTLSAEDHPLLHQLITHFDEKTGCPVLINTSFNERGEPMVCSPKDAILCFLNTGMDVLVLGNQMVLKSEIQSDYSRWLRTYELD